MGRPQSLNGAAHGSERGAAAQRRRRAARCKKRDLIRRGGGNSRLVERRGGGTSLVLSESSEAPGRRIARLRVAGGGGGARPPPGGGGGGGGEAAGGLSALTLLLVLCEEFLGRLSLGSSILVRFDVGAFVGTAPATAEEQETTEQKAEKASGRDPRSDLERIVFLFCVTVKTRRRREKRQLNYIPRRNHSQEVGAERCLTSWGKPELSPPLIIDPSCRPEDPSQHPPG